MFAAAEALLPRRRRALSRARRWPGNLGVLLLDGLLVRVIAPAGAVGFALWAQARGWGVLAWVDWPGWIEAVVAFVLLDLAIYGQHVLVHRVPMLWRFHRMHHADRDFDATTGVRFHPGEILFSLGLKLLVVTALGAPPAAVLLFEVVLNGTSLFNHANLKLPARLDAVLRWIVVTPDMHRVHHSVRRAEHDTNFGFNLPWWDRMFRTYRAQPADGHGRMSIGLDAFRSEPEARLGEMLTQPFRDDAGG
jgi:sterol desaturase/sphingolipid hydroxylase (fatty acid hydroxylase superfamily)